MTLDQIKDAIGVKPYYEEDAGIIYCADCLDIMKKMPDKCVDLVCTDPPYNINKDTWDKKHNYYDWIIDRFIECDRILKDTGSFWYFHMIFPLMATIHIGIELKTELRHKQLITIDKGLGSIAGRTSDNLKTFPRATEYLQFYTYEDPTGAEQLSDKIAKRNPMAAYLKQEISRSKKTQKEIAALFPSKTGGVTGCVSNWLLGYNFPLKEQYNKIRNYLNGDYLRREYEDLRREYEDLRRPFHLPIGITDVWQINFSDGHNNGHCTEKPIEILTRIINAASNPDNIALDLFLGSGTTAVAAKQLGRKYIGIEISETYCSIAKHRLSQEVLSL